MKVSLRYLLLFILSLLWFHIFVGVSALNPFNYTWLRGDGVIHLYGWLFYQGSDWGTPWTYFDHLAYPVGVLSVQLDVIPLIALAVKSITHEPVQYFGLWLFSCFFLMLAFGEKILRAVGYEDIEACLFSSFFVLSTPFLNRFDHASLSAHWVFLCLILWGMVGSNRLKTFLFVGLLLCFLTGVHPYLFAMVGGIFIVWLVTDRSLKFYVKLPLTVLLFGSALGLLAGYGYFSLKSGTGYGFGSYNMDLLGWFNSQGRSLFVPGLRSHGGSYESLSYLGLGLIISIMAGVIWGRKSEQRFSSLFVNGLVVSFVLCLLYSYMDKIRFGGNIILDLEGVLAPFKSITSSLRVSGRFIWPFFYLIIVWYLFKVHNWCPNRKWRNLILIFVLGVQVVELWPMRRPEVTFSPEKLMEIRRYLKGSELLSFQPAYVGFFEDGTRCFPEGAYNESEASWVLVAAALEKVKTSAGYFARAQDVHKILCSADPAHADVVVYSKSSGAAIKAPNISTGCLELESLIICKSGKSI